MDTVKKKMRRIIKRMISVVITLSMLVQYLPVNWLQDVFATGEKTFSVKFSEQGMNYKKGGDHNYLVSASSNEVISMNAILQANWNQQDGYAKGTNLKVNLPWFYRDANGNIVYTTDPRKTKQEHPEINYIGGIEAQIDAKSGWFIDTPTDSEYGIGNETDTNGNSQTWYRTTLSLSSLDDTKFNSSVTNSVKFKFFTEEGCEIPENTSAAVSLSASYRQFYNNSDVLVSDGLQNAEITSDSVINLVNSNLNWETSVETISKPVLWDEYNYVVYKVDIANKSEGTSDSVIDYFQFTLNVPTNATGNGGVLEEDMMAWKVDSNNNYEQNSDTSEKGHENSFGGKYQEGGALIWDVTDNEPKNFDIDAFVKSRKDEHPEDYTKSDYSYIYPQAGQLSVKVGNDKNTEGNLKNNQHRTFYVAVPYVNNFGASTTDPHDVDLIQTVYYGGRSLAWSQTKQTKFTFETQKTNFEHEKYLLDDTKNAKVYKKDVSLGKNFSYYLGGFKNKSNTPVFNAYTVDTLPDKFNLSSLAIEMNNNGVLEDWFKSDEDKPVDLPSIISLKFKNKNNEESWVTLKDLGITVSKDENIWKLDGIDSKLKEYLKNNPNLEFTRDVKFEFKERIAVDEAFDGRIVVTGYGKHLQDYNNVLNTSYEQWSWTSQPLVDNKAGYQKTKETVKTPAQATATGKRAEPKINGFGVLHGKPDQVKQTQEVSLANENAAIRFTLGNTSSSEMLPAEFNLDGLLNSKGAGLVASSIRLSPDLVQKSKINSIELINQSGVTSKIDFSSLTKEADNSILISNTKWTGKLAGVKINFDEFSQVTQNDQPNYYIEINGTPNAIGSYNFTGNFTTKYDIPDTEEDLVSSTATLNVQQADPKVEGFGVLHDSTDPTDSTKDTVKNGQQVSIGDENAAIRYRLGNTSDYEIAPGEFNVTGLLTSKKGAYAGLEASSIYFSPMLVSKSKIDSILLENVNGTQLKITKDVIDQYKKQDGSISIPKSVWEDTIPNLCNVKVSFEEFSANVPDTQKDCYIEINGMPNSTGTYNYLGNFTTKYNSLGTLAEKVDEKRQNAMLL